MEVDSLNLGVHHAPNRPDERANYSSEPEIKNMREVRMDLRRI